MKRRLLYSSSVEEGNFQIRGKDKEARRRNNNNNNNNNKKKKKMIGSTGKFFIIRNFSLAGRPHIVVTVFAYLLSSFLAQQMVCVCVLSPATSSLPTCSMEVFHKN